MREHFKSLNLYCENYLIHIDFVESKSFYSVRQNKLSSNEISYEIYSSIRSWFLKELLISFFLIRIMKKHEMNKVYDAVNFHVAYPLLVHYSFIKKFIRIPILITEHWTAYQLNFNLPKSTKKLNRIKQIFHRKIPLLSVSKALLRDIENFSGTKQSNSKVIPNVVDTDNFYYQFKEKRNEPVFFALNNWRRVKDPITLLKAFNKLVKIYPGAKLVIGGYGEMWTEMQQFTIKHNLSESIDFLGKLLPDQIAKEMRGKTAFVHSSNVETFSVVVAEALCCGTPVIVTKLPCIEEYFSSECGLLVENNDEDNWVEAMVYLIEQRGMFDEEQLSNLFRQKFSQHTVGKQYYNFINGLVSEFGG